MSPTNRKLLQCSPGPAPDSLTYRQPLPAVRYCQRENPVEPEKNEERFTRTVAFMKQRKAEKEKDGRWTGKVSLVLGATGAAAVVLTTLYFLFR